MTGIGRRESLQLIAAGLTGLAVPAALASTPSGGGTLYYNGDILTMEGDIPTYVEALVEQNGRIAFTGTLRDARKLFPHARRRNLADGRSCRDLSTDTAIITLPGYPRSWPMSCHRQTARLPGSIRWSP